MIKILRKLADRLEFWNCHNRHLWNSFLDKRKVKTICCSIMSRKCTRCEIYETDR